MQLIITILDKMLQYSELSMLWYLASVIVDCQ